jgi:Reverse transcriptase (RNA-dependent DNA polymerase)
VAIPRFIGVDFTEAYSPVNNDRTLLLIQLIFGLCAWLLDVQVASLYGDLDELISYMFCKALYDLVQAARQFFKKFISIMKAIGFEQNPAEPCRLFKKDDSNTFTIIVIHVDDGYMIGTKENLALTVKMIESHGFKVKVETETKDYLGCEILIYKSGSKAWLGQPCIVKKMLSCFAERNGGSNVKYKTPGTPGFDIIRPITPQE